MRTLSAEIDHYDAFNSSPPASLAEIGRGGLVDPWGIPCLFANFGGVVERKPGGGGDSAGKARKDKNLVPLNTTCDLYGMGAGGRSQAPLGAKVSLDDILRANDGAWIGLASGY